ncbi:hypothetical protein Ancab_032755 [Ancistrocladus abbreviatus]
MSVEGRELSVIRKRFSLPFVLLLIFLSKSSPCPPNKISHKRLVFYYHDILYNGDNFTNPTSTIVAAPQWGNLTKLADFSRYGDVVVFNDPITLDNRLNSKPVGWAQGLYLYDKKETFMAWWAFTISFNSTDLKGTLTFMGADPLLDRTKDLSVVGGTGDLFMSRGVATIRTDAIEAEVYFGLRFDVKLYM